MVIKSKINFEIHTLRSKLLSRSLNSQYAHNIYSGICQTLQSSTMVNTCINKRIMIIRDMITSKYDH